MADPQADKASLNMDASTFDSDLYLQKVLKECSLKQVMDTEAEIVRDTQTLHSDMQTLVYENYNKFISATDTIRQMKTDFKQMETEMGRLVTQMGTINAFSDRIAGTLHGTRQQLGKLSQKHALLQKLQFLSSLPSTLKALRADKNYRQAVQDYGQAQKVLQQYGQQPSFQGIQSDCERTMADIRAELRADFEQSSATAGRLRDTGALLLLLAERPADLAASMLVSATQRLHQQTVVLQDQTERDVQRFVEMSVDGFLSELNLVVDAYTEMFFTRAVLDAESDDFPEKATADLNAFVAKNMDKYVALVQARVDIETGRGDSSILLRALDRLHRRLLAMKGLKCDVELNKIGLDIIINAAKQLCNYHLRTLREFLADSISSVRLALTTSSATGSGNALKSPDSAPKSATGSSSTTTAPNLSELIHNLYQSTMEKVRGVLQDLLIFVQPELSFNLRRDPKGLHCIRSIRERLLVGFLRHAAHTMRSLAANDGQQRTAVGPPNLHLVLSKTCLEFERAGVRQLLAQTDELYGIATPSASADAAALTTDAELGTEMREAAQQLIDAYVRLQGGCMSQMLRKSVETRDWLNCLEPRSVRAVMKRCVEELADVETTLGDLFETGARTTASSDSSRRTLVSNLTAISSTSKQTPQQQQQQQQQLLLQQQQSASSSSFHRSTWSNYAPMSALEMGGFASNVHRLFSERIDIFSSVEFSKVSIVTGIVKISLKTLLECVRLRTFSRFGLQQIQVDAHYLQMNLWRFVSDENMIHFLLDEILGSAVHRCLEPNLMEPNAVEIICERA